MAVAAELLALAEPAAAAAAPTLVVTRGCEASIPVERESGHGEGVAFSNGSGFAPNEAAAINYTRLPTGATASDASANPPAYHDQEVDPSGEFVQGIPPHVEQGTGRRSSRPGDLVAKDLDTQVSSNWVSFQVAVTGVVAPKHVRRKAKLHLHAFAVGLTPVGGASSTAYAHFVQGLQDVRDAQNRAPG